MTPTTAANVERATATDLATIEALLAGLGLPIDGLRAHAASVLVVRDGGEAVGSIALELYGEAALLRSLAVRADRQGTGLGTHLTEAAVDLAHRNGVRELYLL